MTNPKPEKIFLRYRLPVFLWAIVIFVASSIRHVRLPKIKFIAVDKVVHMGVFFIFGLLLYRALYTPEIRNRINMKRLFIMAFITIAYGVSDEFHQLFVPGRQFDIYDMIADGMGGVLAGLIIYVFLLFILKV